MRRVFLLALAFAFVLIGCGGTSDTTVGPPPQATPIEATNNPQVDKIISQLKQTVPQQMQAQKVKPETIEQKVYRSTASLQDIERFYNQLTQKGWSRMSRMPGAQGNILYDSYTNGSTSLIIVAFDASQFGESGVIMYTAKGTT